MQLFLQFFYFIMDILYEFMIFIVEDLKNFINGMSPIPGAWTEFQGKKIKGLYHFISIGNVDEKKYKQQQYMLFKSKLEVTDPIKITNREKMAFAKQAKSIQDVIRGKIS